MPRAPRLWFPGAWYHVMARGNNKQPIFFAEHDYRKYLQLLKELLIRYECRLHTYALMTNHIHLLIETGEQYPVGKLIQALHTAYTEHVNHKYRRVGHLFQGRYRSRLVEQDVYAVVVSRYIHLNPVRAGLVTRPEQYCWSSCRAYFHPDQGGGFVTTQVILGMTGQNALDQRQRYQEFIEAGCARPQYDVFLESMRQQILGSPIFVEEVKRGVRPQGV